MVYLREHTWVTISNKLNALDWISRNWEIGLASRCRGIAEGDISGQ